MALSNPENPETPSNPSNPKDTSNGESQSPTHDETVEREPKRRRETDEENVKREDKDVAMFQQPPTEGPNGNEPSSATGSGSQGQGQGQGQVKEVEMENGPFAKRDESPDEEKIRALGEPLWSREETENPDGVERVVAGWSGRERRNREFIIRYGPADAPIYRLETANDAPADYDVDDPPVEDSIGYPEERLGNLKVRGRFVYTKKHLGDIYGVAWAAGTDPVEALTKISPTERDHLKKWGVTRVLVVWDKDNKLALRWEDRTCIRVREGKDNADQRIYKFAVWQELRFKYNVAGIVPDGKAWPTKKDPLDKQLDALRRLCRGQTSTTEQPLPSVENDVARETRLKGRRPPATTSGAERSREQTPEWKAAAKKVLTAWKQSYLDVSDQEEANLKVDPKAMANYTTAWNEYRKTPEYTREVEALV